MGVEHGQIGAVGVFSPVKGEGGAVGDAEARPIVDPAEIVGIVRVDVIGGELPRDTGVGREDVPDIHLALLCKKGSRFLRIIEGVGGGAVGKGEWLLRLVTRGFVGDDPVADAREHRLKGRRLRTGAEIFAAVAVMPAVLRVLFVGKGDRGALPLHAEDVADHPARDVPAIGARAARPSAGRKLARTVYHIEHHAAFFEKVLAECGVIGVAHGTLHLVVDPYPLQQPQGIGVVFVEFVQRAIKHVLPDGIDADGVGAHLFDLAEPAKIGIAVDGVASEAKICGIRQNRKRDDHTHRNHNFFHSRSIVTGAPTAAVRGFILGSRQSQAISHRNKKTAATKKRCGRSIIRPMTLQTPWLCAPAFRQVCPLCGFRLSKSAYYYQVYDIIIGDSGLIVNTKMPKKPTFVNFRVITHRF